MRVVIVPALCARSNAASSPQLPMLCTAVTPCALTYAMAPASARSTIAAGAGGTTRSTTPIALSLNTPVNSPDASRTIVPPDTSFTSRVTPAALSAAVLARFMCPSRRLIHTGVSGVTESIHCRAGSSPPQFS